MEMHILTTADSSDETVIGMEGNTDLHKPLLSVCKETDTNAVSNRDIGESMPWQGAKLSLPNAQGHTTIGCAVNQRDKTCVESRLMHPSAHRLHLDHYTDSHPFLTSSLMESLDSSEKDKKLLAALQGDKYDIFMKNLSPKNPIPWYGDPYNSSLLEIACQMKNRERFVEYLLVIGADPNTTNRVTGMPLLHATARSGNLELLEMLLLENRIDVNVKDSEQRTILHWWAWVGEKNQVIRRY